MNRELIRDFEGSVDLQAQTNPFSPHVVQTAAPAGHSVQDILEHLGSADPRCIEVQLNGSPVKAKYWHQVYPKPGQQLDVVTLPMGGQGDGNKVVRTVLQIAVLAASVYTAGTLLALEAGTAGYAVTVGAGTMLGNLAVNAIVPPPKPSRSKDGDQGRDGVANRITGIKNRANKHGAVPYVFGRHRMYPPFASIPVFESRGNAQFLRQLFTCGYGPVKISNMRIGDTPLSNFSNYEIETREGRSTDQPITLYTDDINPEKIEVTLSDSWTQRQTKDNVDEITVGFYFPRGLVDYKKTGGLGDITVDLEVEYAVAGSGNWQKVDGPFPSISINRQMVEPFGVGLNWEVPTDQYDVRVRRANAESNANSVQDSVNWRSLKSIREQEPVQTDYPISLVALKIRATDQLSGHIDRFNCLVERYAKEYDPGNDTWNDDVLTRNPASMYRDMLQSNALRDPRPDSALDLNNLEDWWEFCDQYGYEYNAVIDQEDNARELAGEIARAGRGSRNMLEGKWGVVWDEDRSNVVQHFTPNNIYDFQGEVVLSKQAEALEVDFINEDADYQQDTRLVKDENVGTPSRVESMGFPGVTDPKQIWRLARYHMAVGRERKETWTFGMDFEHVIATRGTRGRMVHDVIETGLGTGRITDVIMSEGHAVAVELDSHVEMDQGESYSLRIRQTAGDSLHTVKTVPGETDRLEFATPISDQSKIPSEQDLYMFGIQGQVTEEVIVKQVKEKKDFEAELVVAPYAPAVYDVDSVADADIPTFSSNVESASQLAAPIIDQVLSGTGIYPRAHDQSRDARIVADLDVDKQEPGGKLVSMLENGTLEIEAQYKLSNNERWKPAADIRTMVGLIEFSPVDVGETYDLRVRFVDEDGGTSDWAVVTGHTVEGDLNAPPEVTDVPAQPSQPTIDWQETYYGRNSEVRTLTVVSVPALPARAQSQSLLLRKSGSNEWSAVDRFKNNSQILDDIPDLTPGVEYEIALRAWSSAELASSLSSTTVFTARSDMVLDDFEDGNVVEYAGEDSYFTPVTDSDLLHVVEDMEDQDVSYYGGDKSYVSHVTSPVKEGSYAIHLNPPDNSTAVVISSTNDEGGALGEYPDLGNTFTAWVRGTGDVNPRVLFFTQGENNDPACYAVQLGIWGDYIEIFRRDPSETQLAASQMSPNTSVSTWYQVEVTVERNGDITARALEGDGTEIGSVTANDTTYTDGGIGWMVPDETGASDPEAYFDIMECQRLTTYEGAYICEVSRYDSTAAINRIDKKVAKGDTFEFYLAFDVASINTACLLGMNYAVQNEEGILSHSCYNVGVNPGDPNGPLFDLRRWDGGTPGRITSATLSGFQEETWYRIVLEWGFDDVHTAHIYKPDGTEFGNSPISGTDANYEVGGFGWSWIGGPHNEPAWADFARTGVTP